MRSSICLTWLLLVLFCLKPSFEADIAMNSAWIREVKLNLTECQPEADRTELNCDREGFFVHGFGRHVFWVRPRRKTWIPASPSTCCRPEIPNIPEIPHGPELTDEDTHPVDIISVGCHLSTNRMSCEASGHSFVMGFVDEFTPRERRDLHVPHRGVTCCTPVMLMASGNVWNLRPCHCEPSETQDGDVFCGDGKLVRGFGQAIRVQDHEVPIPPVECCSLCLGDYLFDMSRCDHLGSCHGNGVCIMGSCECYPDWIGEDCTGSKEEFYAEPTLESSVWWLGGLGFIGAFFCLFATFWIIRRTEQESSIHGNDRGFLGLISSYITDTGSVGSVDTESGGSEMEEGENEQSTDQQQQQQQPKTRCEADQDSYEPLLQMSCCICETHPVQVTLVPCGHSNLCRKCSRKLTSCPFCRKPIVRRQRLFLSV